MSLALFAPLPEWMQSDPTRDWAEADRDRLLQALIVTDRLALQFDACYQTSDSTIAKTVSDIGLRLLDSALEALDLEDLADVDVGGIVSALDDTTARFEAISEADPPMSLALGPSPTIELSVGSGPFLPAMFCTPPFELDPGFIEPKGYPDAELERQIRTIQAEVERLRQLLLTGGPRNHISNRARMDFLKRVLQAMLRERQNRIALYYQILLKIQYDLMSKRIAEAIRRGQNQAAVFMALVLLPLLPYMFGKAFLGYSQAARLLITRVLSPAATRALDMLDGPGGTVLSFVLKRVVSLLSKPKQYYELIWGWLLRHPGLIAALHGVGYRFLDKIKSDPVFISDLEELAKALRDLIKRKRVDTEDAEILLRLVEVLIELKGKAKSAPKPRKSSDGTSLREGDEPDGATPAGEPIPCTPDVVYSPGESLALEVEALREFATAGEATVYFNVVQDFDLPATLDFRDPIVLK